MPTKPCRFASLVRVSTEKQEKEGESLATQRKDNERDVAFLGGKIVGWYGGQEHATPGWEKKELDRLIADAAAGKFDAVIASNADRWSRDNSKSREGLEVFREHGVRFFVSVTEYDLHKPEHNLFLNLSSVIGEFQASQQSMKSLLNRIERAKSGAPASGNLPFGRTYDKKTGRWGIDPAKQALIEEVATRYLAGESLLKMAREKSINHSNLAKTLREFSGTEWFQTFRSKAHNINETVATTIPALLPDDVVRAVRARLTGRRTFHGTPKSNYLLSGHVFCASCGYVLAGQTNPGGLLYYRHTSHPRNLSCPLASKRKVGGSPYDPTGRWFRADKLEEEVISQLFDMFGNPAEIERAVKRAVPDCDRTQKRRATLAEELAKIDRARERVLGLIEKELITDDEAEKKLRELKERQASLRTELALIDAALADVPDEDTVRRYVEKVGDLIWVYDDTGHTAPGGNDLCTYLMMTYADKRKLVLAVFGLPLADGTPAGVYVNKDGSFTIKGRLEFERVISASSTAYAGR